LAFKHGKGTVFKVDDSGGTLRDISAFVTNVDFGRELDAPETTTFGDNDREFIVGLRGHNFSISGIWDNTATTGSDAVISSWFQGTPTAVTATFEYGPEGGAAGAIRYTGEAIPTSYSVSSPVDGVATFTADWIVTGAVTRNTFP
jgi:hypothetical protein